MSQAPAESRLARLGRALLHILRLLFTLALLGGVVAAVYFGAPLLYDRYIAPLEADTSQLQAQIDAQATQIAVLSDQVEQLSSRLEAANRAKDEQAQRLATLQTQTQALEETQRQLETLQADLESLQTGLQDQLDGQRGLQTEMEALQRQIQALGLLQSLNRARLYLVQGNYGLAQADLQTAYRQAEVLPLAEESRRPLLDNLQRAAEALPEKPVLASGHLDLAWEAMLSLVAPPVQPPPPPATPTPTPTAAP